MNNQDEKIKSVEFLLTGFFEEKGKKSEFKITLWPGIFTTSEKYKWLDDDKSQILIQNEAVDLLGEIEKKSQAQSIYYGEGNDYLGDFTVGFMIHDNQSPTVGFSGEPRENNDVVFFKKYDNNNPHSLTIIYIGKFENQNKIIGQWFALGVKGNFEINCEGCF